MTNCDPRIEDFMKAVETEKIRSSKEVKALVSHVRNCFETEDIYVDSEQLTKYIGIARYFPLKNCFRGRSLLLGCTIVHTGEYPGHLGGRIFCACWDEVLEKMVRSPGKLLVWSAHIITSVRTTWMCVQTTRNRHSDR